MKDLNGDLRSDRVNKLASKGNFYYYNSYKM